MSRCALQKPQNSYVLWSSYIGIIISNGAGVWINVGIHPKIYPSFKMYTIIIQKWIIPNDCEELYSISSHIDADLRFAPIPVRIYVGMNLPHPTVYHLVFLATPEKYSDVFYQYLDRILHPYVSLSIEVSYIWGLHYLYQFDVPIDLSGWRLLYKVILE